MIQGGDFVKGDGTGKAGEVGCLCPRPHCPNILKISAIR